MGNLAHDGRQQARGDEAVMRCSQCGKRLSRKRARMIEGKVLCSPCVFGQAPRDSGSGRHGGDNLLAPGEAPQSGGVSRIAQTSPKDSIA